MNEYPDKWVVVKITPSSLPVHYRVLAGWGGSYLYGASWRMNSGITSVAVEGDYLVFTGASGSKYYCHKNTYGYTSMTANVARSYGESLAKEDVLFEVLPEQTDFLSIDYGE